MKQKLGLTWIGMNSRPKLELRILLSDTSKSYNAKQRLSENDIIDNQLIFGDNLLALKAMMLEFLPNGIESKGSECRNMTLTRKYEVEERRNELIIQLEEQQRIVFAIEGELR